MQIKLSSAQFSELTSIRNSIDNANSITVLVIRTINANEQGLYNSKSDLALVLNHAMREFCQLVDLLNYMDPESLGAHESEMMRVELVVKATKLFTLLENKFCYEVTQDNLVNESRHETQEDHVIDNSLFGVYELIRQADSRFGCLFNTQLAA